MLGCPALSPRFSKAKKSPKPNTRKICITTACLVSRFPQVSHTPSPDPEMRAANRQWSHLSAMMVDIGS